MSASMSVTANKFLELSQLYEEKDSVFSVVGCAYIIKNKKATQTQKNHCGNPTHEDTIKIAKIYLEGLYGILCEDNECSPKGAGIDFNHILEELVQYFLCKGRHREKDNQANLKKQWSEELSAFKKRCQLREQLKLYLANLNNNPASVPDGSGLRAPNSENLNTTPKRAGTKLIKSLPSTPLSKRIVEFEPYSPKKTPQDQGGDKSIARNLSNMLETTLKGKSLKTGWVYVIAYPPAKNMFKVGISENPDQRLKEHQECYGNSISYRAKEEINYCYLIEQVILTELDREHRKLKNKCHNCGKCHKEWVNADEGKLMEVFNKWVKFARKDPYDEKGELKAGVKLPPSAGIFIYQDTKESRRKSDIGYTKPLERSLLGDFKTKGRSRHSEVGLSRSQISSQSRSSSDEFDSVALSERFTQLTVKDAH
ncbi:hypothetical protein N7488_005353 [Penicillium malachiteum]|nr:hypothetical protein N7488_005353 [Penicillium malachiteum]